MHPFGCSKRAGGRQAGERQIPETLREPEEVLEGTGQIGVPGRLSDGPVQLMIDLKDQPRLVDRDLGLFGQQHVHHGEVVRRGSLGGEPRGQPLEPQTRLAQLIEGREMHVGGVDSVLVGRSDHNEVVAGQELEGLHDRHRREPQRF